MNRCAVVLVLVAACSSPAPGGGPIDAGPIDAGPIDAGPIDAGPLPTVGFASQTSNGGEGGTVDGTQIDVQVSLDAEAAEPVSVRFAVTGGSAVEGTDFELVEATGTVAIERGRRFADIPIHIKYDHDEEIQEETIELTLVSAVGAEIGSRTKHTVKIAPNTLPRVQIDPPAVVSEDETVHAIGLRLDKAALEDLEVSYTLLPGATATPIEDFDLRDRTVTIPAGAKEATIEVTVVDDDLHEGSESFEISISASAGALVGNKTHRHTILDNDAPPTVGFASAAGIAAEAGTANVDVTLSKVSALPITVRYAVVAAVSSATGGGVDFTLADGTLTFPPGTTRQPIAVAIQPDDLDELNETITLGLSGAVTAALGQADSHVLTISDDDGREGTLTVGFVNGIGTTAETGTASIAVALSGVAETEVTVDYAVVIGASSATGGGSDFTLANGKLTFPPGTTTLPIEVAIEPDELDEHNETITLALSQPTHATLARSDSHVLTIADDDALPLAGFPSGQGQRIPEGDTGFTEARFPVVLSAPSGRPVTVIVVVGGVGILGEDYEVGAGDIPVVFEPGQTLKDIRMLVIGDEVQEQIESVSLRLRDVTNARLRNVLVFLEIDNDD